MKTWVLWTHYDCEVYVTLHASEWDAWKALMDGWLECDEDCGHEPDTFTTGAEVSDAIEYHFEELSYDIKEMEAPLSIPPIEQNGVQPVPDRNTMPAERADSLLSSLQSYTEGS